MSVFTFILVFVGTGILIILDILAIILAVAWLLKIFGFFKCLKDVHV